eukprot:gb/GECG01001712.1/.p1 GENE.gb/GECG01001712.1/~~gb/GECG01001712.1/.p1  ORF type:complete len:296 (+),score=23.00 gb/GECG01001712.1/:1-888(+)
MTQQQQQQQQLKQRFRKHTTEIHAVPPHLQFNPYIEKGYRRNPISPENCVKELVSYFHNELFNIFSHGIQLVICFTMFLRKLMQGEILELQHEVEYGWIETCFLFGGILVFGGSVLYHTFLSACESTEAYRRLLLVDVMGVWLINSIITWKCFWLTFFCWSPYLKLIAIVLPLGFACSILLNATKASSRGAAFALMAAFRLGVLIVRVLRLGYTLDTSGGFYLWIAAEIGGFVGGLVNVLRIPEKWPNRPHWIDLVGNSHNIMHVCTVISYWIVWFAFWLDAKTAVTLKNYPVCN